MGRSFERSGDNQSIPDVLLQRRSGIPVSVDVPVAEAEARGLPLYNFSPPGDDGSVWDAIPPLTIDFSKDIGRIVFGGEYLWTLTRKGASLPKVKVKENNGKTATSILTSTSKMMCPSLSLPAGPPSEQGTCLAAEKMLKAGLQNDPLQICGQCYACEGNYRFPDPTISQMATLAWIRQRCLDDPTGNALADDMTATIAHYASSTTLGSMNRRLIQEIGLWSSDNRCIMVPCSIPAVGRYWKQAAIETPLQGLPWADSRSMFESMAPEDGEVVGFFRWHDSGDFNIHRTAWKTYLLAIYIVASRFPRVMFWMPTRTWEFPAMLRQLVAIRRKFGVSNLIVRPSSNLSNQQAPIIAGLDAGSTVRVKGTRKSFAARNCPAYSGNGTSCMNEGCRDCWIQPELTVQYRSH